jgi:phycocyanobilin lyase alpha subunit
MDLGATGYLPAASAIANTLAENSLKLVALKELLENHMKTNSRGENIAEILTLMDGLL